MRERQVQMEKKENTGGFYSGCWRLLGILLMVVCLFCNCGKEEAVFTAGGEGGQESLPDTAEPSKEIENSEEKIPDRESKSPVEASDIVVVYVCGQVRSPGVYELEAGERIADAIELAGGMTEEAAADALNLARELTDAQMIRVPSQEEVEKGVFSENTWPGQTEEASGISGVDNQGRISLNTATREQLMTLSGIGEAKADAILQYRQEHGSFNSIEEIMNIPGIKQGVFLKIKDQITV